MYVANFNNLTTNSLFRTFFLIILIFHIGFHLSSYCFEFRRLE